MSIRVFLVDDDPLVRSSLRLYFETTDDISVVAEAANGAECLSMLDNVDADIVLADIHMPTMDGITLLRKIKERPYPPVFLAVTSFDSDDTMLKILQEGGAGYILKNQRPQSIIDAVHEAIHGGTVVAPVAMHRLVGYIGDAPRKDPVATAIETHHLSTNEINVLKLLLQGNSNSEIAAALEISESSVKKHVSSLIVTFNASTRLNLVTKILGGAGS
ncbi:DNA-binding response regulator [Corynebacterium sp. HMSC08C04]|uniref:response regulator n=1 Tax=Corynebacterium TaxID=1716 RepID=UPI0007820B81|nr:MULTISPECIES: response regulator transcription factor [Corynebacterium]AMO89133.1 bacterial regulatory s, luxR family protein [Corynebacterium simulans]MDU3173881.1 response regulator transcription factor [Corynebacterium striatum]OFT35379.1 DNA-binding response regulator [Corynebacterium sp. HMSC08C04]